MSEIAVLSPFELLHFIVIHFRTPCNKANHSVFQLGQKDERFMIQKFFIISFSDLFPRQAAVMHSALCILTCGDKL